MIYGLYLSSQGAAVQAQRLEVVANNIANAQTDGFKRDLAVFQSHPPHDAMDGTSGNGPHGWNEHTGGTSLADIVTDFSQGPLEATGGTYDVALAGPGFLRIAGPGEELLTRGGRLAVDPRGELVTQSTGSPVLGEGGRHIRIPAGATQVTIDGAGQVQVTDPEGGQSTVGRLDVVLPEQVDRLQKIGDGYYRNPGSQKSAPPGAVEVRQGHLESAGTQTVLEMLDLIDASRSFESNVNMVRTQDESLGRLLQSVARR